MKPYLALLLFALLPAALFSRDITTLSGTTYKDAKVMDSNPKELIISYKDKEETVLKPVEFRDLPDDIKKEFKYDPVKAAAYEKEVIDAEKKLAKEKQAEGKKEAAKKKKVNQGDVVTEGEINPPEVDINVAPAPVDPGQIGGGTAPGEKDGKAEAKAIKAEALERGLAPEEKEGDAEADKIRKDARGE